MSPARYPLVLYGQRDDRISLDALAERTGIPPQRIADYVELGLLEPCERVGERLWFTPVGLVRLRCIERLRRELGINLTGIAVVLDLLDRIQRLQRELEWRRL